VGGEHTETGIAVSKGQIWSHVAASKSIIDLGSGLLLMRVVGCVLLVERGLT
jgi:3D (Asp-Asp-Asp) domain-containing protein